MAMIRPNSMYIDAANSAGASSKNNDWMMYGVSLNKGAWVLETMRAIYPIISTAREDISKHAMLTDR